MKRIAIIALLWSSAAVAEAHAQSDILFAELTIPQSIDRWYNGVEYPRLSALCNGNAACESKEVERKTWVLNPVYSAPTAKSRRLGTLVAVAAATPDRHLHFRIDFRLPNGRHVDWITDIGDWGYGLEFFVRARKGSWIPLAEGRFPSPAWIELTPHREDGEGRLMGGAGSIVGAVVDVADDIPAIHRATGRSTKLSAAVEYVIEKISNGWAYLRQEVGADMPCGETDEEKDIPTAETPRFRVRMKNLFDGGEPKVGPAYGRGC